MNRQVTLGLMLLLAFPIFPAQAQSSASQAVQYSVIGVNSTWGFFVINSGKENGISPLGYFQSVDGSLKLSIKQIDNQRCICEAWPQNKQSISLGMKVVWVPGYAKPNSQIPIKAKKVELPENLVGQVSKTNPTWGYCLINVGSAQGLKVGMRLIVYRGQSRLCTGVISVVEPSQSAVELQASKGQRVEVDSGDRVEIMR